MIGGSRGEEETFFLQASCLSKHPYLLFKH